ncbi:MAG TPA: VWA domain-containing protein [Gammaproteobacteria bacterium]|nr:VWA domain-containing protein [Gammaproteobacteria bacterium]
MMSEFHFIRPLWLLALLPCGALLAWYYLRRRHQGLWTGYVEPQLWPHVLAGFDETRRLRPLLLTAFAATLCVLALAGPAWQRQPQPVFRNQSALVIVLDLSSSMDSQDIKPSRLQRARQKLLDVLERRREGQTALVVYAGAAFAVTPLTDDVNTIRGQVADLETRLMPAQGERADLAVEKTLELLAQGGVQRGHVLIITDHIDTDRFESARDRLLGAGHGLSILGVGTPEGAPVPLPNGGFLKDSNGAIVVPKLNESGLRSLAPYRRITVDDKDIDYLLPDSNPELLADQGEETGLKTDTWRDEGPWLLLPLLLLSVLAFRRGLLLWSCLPLYLLTLPWAQPAHAFSWRDLWLNDNQQAKRAFDAQQYENAQQRFEDPEWRAASAYRRGDYEQAAQALAATRTADGLYNRGNALAQLGKVEAAIASYNAALEQNPQHEDARHNRDLLLQQQKQQPQNQNGQSGQQQNPQQDQQAQQNPRQNQPGQTGQQQDQQSQQGQQPEQSQQQAGQSQSPAGDQQQPPQQEKKSGSEQQQSAQQGKEQQQKQQAADSGERDQQQAQQQQEQAQAAAEAGEKDPERQNMEQWLRRVPDDPGGLLRRKFLYQYRRQQQEQQQ